METNWYVIAGPPSSGKTTLIHYFSSLGYAVLPETARMVIDRELREGKTLQEIRSDNAVFQRKVLAERLFLEGQAPVDVLTFLDTAIPCAAAYCKLTGVDPQFIFDNTAKRYRGVFLLDSLPTFEKDDVRTENMETALILGNLLFEVYSGLGYEVIKIPAESVEARAQVILNIVKTPISKNFKHY